MPQYVKESGGRQRLERLVATAFTEAEISSLGWRASTEAHVARLLAKQLVVELVSPELPLGDIEIRTDGSGQPRVSVAGLSAPDVERIHVSLSHDGEMAAALVVQDAP